MNYINTIYIEAEDDEDIREYAGVGQLYGVFLCVMAPCVLCLVGFILLLSLSVVLIILLYENEIMGYLIGYIIPRYGDTSIWAIIGVLFILGGLFYYLGLLACCLYNGMLGFILLIKYLILLIKNITNPQ